MTEKAGMYDHEPWAKIARANGYEPFDTESVARAAFKCAAEIFEALEEAVDHLSYCGYGDSYERECAEHNQLPERLEALVAKYNSASK